MINRSEESLFSPKVLIAFIIPTLMFVYLRIGGLLFLPEVIMMTGAVSFILSKNARLNSNARTIFALGALWLISQVLTDYVRNTPFVDYVRGWAKIVVLLIIFLFMLLFIGKNPNRIWAFVLGLAAGDVLKFIISPRGSALARTADGYWKSGFAVPVTLTICCLLCAPGRQIKRIHAFVILLILSIVHILLGFRSLGGLVFATGLLLLVSATNSGHRTKTQATSTLKTIVIVIIALFIFSQLYEYAINNAWTEYSLKAKDRSQRRGAFGYLLGGRQELYVSLRAIWDSPLLGHGSWAKSFKYYNMLNDLKRYGYETINLDTETDYLIPAHSYIFGAWVEAGILGGIFWGWVLALAIKTIAQLAKMNALLSPIYFFIILGLVWNILFSPLGAEGRVHAAFDMMVLLSARREVDEAPA